jgi:phosphatidylglycerol---prolipoprotein diacylglyceryl transferase
MRPRMAAALEGWWAGAGWMVPDFPVLLALAVVLGVHLTVLRAERDALDARAAFRVSVVACGAAFVGARLYVVLQDWSFYRVHPSEIVRVWHGGLASFGAIGGGMAAAVAASRVLRVPAARFLDAAAPSVALSFAIGRVGCFLTGCCYGAASDAAWSVRFPAGSAAYAASGAAGPLSAALHPTQLYEAAGALAVAAVLARVRPRRAGEAFALLFVLYPSLRFVVERWRADPRGTAFAWSLPQFLSFVCLCGALGFLARRRGGEVGGAAAHVPVHG